MLLGMVAAALVCAASDGLECNAKALQLYRAAHYAEAEAMYRRALDAFDRAGEGDGLNRALTLENIAVMLRAQGRYAESEKVHQAALPKIEELTGRASLATVRAVSNLAALYWSWGELEQAESLAIRAELRYTESEKLSRATLAAMQGAFGDGDPRLVRAQVNYARLREETHGLAQARKIKVKTLR